MVTKVLKDRKATVVGEETHRVTGTTAYYPQSYVTKVTADAAWSRPKPKRPQLFPTALSIRRTMSGGNGSWFSIAYNLDCKSRYFTRANAMGKTVPDHGDWYNNVGMDSANRVADALIRARSNMASAPINLGEALVELPETMRMIANRTQTIYQMIKAARKGDWKTLGNILKVDPKNIPRSLRYMPASQRAAKAHLEVIYGWQPLMSDIYGGVQALNQKWAGEGSVIRRSGSVLQEMPPSVYNDGPLRAKVQLQGVVKSKTTATLNQLGLLNPLLMAWNAAPLSFVIDWFLPISTILQSMTYHLGLSLVVGCSVSEAKVVSGNALGLQQLRHDVTRRPISANVDWTDVSLISPSLNFGKVAAAVSLMRTL